MAVYRVYQVDRDTWADALQVNGFLDGKITRSSEGNLIDSGSLSFDLGDGLFGFPEGYYRVARIDGGSRIDVATLYCKASGGEFDKGRFKTDVTGYSVLKPADTAKLVKGEYAPAGSDGVAFAASLLGSYIHAPIEANGSFRLEGSVVFDLSSTVLDAAVKVLEIGGYMLQIEGDGTVVIVSKNPSEAVDIGEWAIEPGIKMTPKVAFVPNRYIAIDGTVVAVAVNDSADSETSEVSTFRVDEVDQSPARSDSETLTAYARRRLRELSIVTEEYSYTRDYIEGIYPGSFVSLGFMLPGERLRVKSQEIECSTALLVTETLSREVNTWSLG